MAREAARRLSGFRGRDGGDEPIVGCRCNEATELYGDEAEGYAREHLRSDEVRTEAFEEDLSCPDTGALWRLDYPEHTEREPGRARLARR